MAANKIATSIAAALTAAALFSATPLFAKDDPIVLLARNGVDTARVRLVEADGILILRGSVPEADDPKQADSVLRSAGYDRVANLLTVKPPLSDDAVRRSVERVLTRTRSLDGSRLNVAVENGVVMLDGTVRRELQIEAANELARSVDGVRDVLNCLVLED